MAKTKKPIKKPAKKKKKAIVKKKDPRFNAIKYNKDLHPSLIEAWAHTGKTEDEICKSVGIARSTLLVWKKKYKAVSIAISRGKDKTIQQAENTLIRIMGGYTRTRTETTVFTNKDGKPAIEQVKGKVIRYANRIKRIVEDVDPHFGAISMFLSNRDPKRWRNKLAVEIDNSAETSEAIRNMEKIFNAHLN